MKKLLFSVAIVTAAVMSVASCQKEQSIQVEGQKELHFIVKGYQNAVTKTTLTDNGDGTYTPGWSADDELGAFLGSTTITKDVSAVDMTLTNTADAGVTATFEGSAVAAGSGTFKAFYPASAFVKGYASGGIGLNIGATNDYKQYPSVGAPDPACNILVSKACDYESDGDLVVIDDLYFTRPLSVLKIKLNGTYAADEEVSSFKLSIPSGTLSGRVDINLSDASINSWTVQKPYVWAEYTESKPVINHASNNTVYFVINPTTIASGTIVTVEAETENYTINKSFTLGADMSFPANEIAVLNLSIAESNCTPKEAVVDETYTLVTAAGAFEVGGKYVFAFKDGQDGHFEFINNKGTSKTIDKNALTISDGEITNPDAIYVFTAEAGSASGTFKFKNSAGNYIYTSGSNTTLNTNNTSASDWLVTFLSASSTYKFQNQNTSGRYISYAGSDAKAYANSNFKDQVESEIALAQYAGAISVFKFSDSRPAPGMSWSATTASASITSTGVVFEAPTLNKGNADVVTYSSENTAVATISAEGVVNVLAEGTTTISATFGGNASYGPSTVSYTLTVTDNRTQVATPTFSPAAGEVTVGSTVSISCATEGAAIHYTTDGTEPTASSATYTTPIEINAATTFKAIAFKDNYKKSEIATAAYTVIVANTSTEENPYSVAEAYTLAGKLSSSQSLANVYVYGIISKIRYNFSEANQNISFNVSANGLESDAQQLYAYKAVATSATQFEVGDAVLLKGSLLNYQGNTPELGEGTIGVEVIKVPTISAESETFTESVSVTLAAAQGATIYYTTDGNDPTTASSVYSEPLTFTQNTTVKAIAKKGVLTTGIVSKTFSKIEVGSQSVTFDFSGFTETVSGGWNGDHTVDPITISATSANTNKAGQVRFQKDGTVTFTGATITRIEIINDGNYPGEFEANVGTYTTEGNNGIWTGSATEVVLTNKGNGTRTTSIVVTYN